MKSLLLVIMLIPTLLFSSTLVKNTDIVDDSTTHLSWQDSTYSSDANISWSDAQNYCSTLELGGYSDWRLPTVNELRSIVDYTRSDGSALNAVFENEPTYIYQNSYYRSYWTSTYRSDDPNNAVRTISFYQGAEGSVNRLTSVAYTRCVRGDYVFGNSSFTRDSTQEVVRDNIRKLIWQDDSSAASVTKTFNEAITYCSELSLAGINNWRVPDMFELTSLVDYTTQSPAINSAFTNVQTNSNYMTSVSNAVNADLAWGVSFYAGYDDATNAKTNARYVRCVADESSSSNNIKIQQGWQFLGTSIDLNTTIFDNSCVDYIWLYESGGWKLYISNSSQYSYPAGSIELNTIGTNRGFWVKGNGNCEVDTTLSDNSGQFTQSDLLGKTFYIIINGQDEMFSQIIP